MIRHAWYAGKNTIAAAVARAIDNQLNEGIALTAEWDRRGSDCMQQIIANTMDASIMARLTRERGLKGKQ